MGILKLVLSTALLANLCFVFSCNKIADRKNIDVLRIGTDATYPPFESIDGNSSKLIGFDVDLMKKICSELNIESQFIVVPFDGIIAGLKHNKYDAIISAMTITEDRKKEVDFSNPYYTAGQSIAVNAKNSYIKDISHLRGKRIGVQLGTTGEIEAKKVQDAKVVSYDNISAAFIDLENERIDAIINDIPTNKSIIKDRNNTLKLAGDVFTKEYYGIAFRKNDLELLQKINNTIDKLQKSGYLDRLKKRWNI